MILRGEKILLRYVQISDLHHILLWENSPENESVNYFKEKISYDTILDWLVNLKNDLNAEKQLRFIMESTGTAKVVGSIDLFDFDDVQCSVGVGLIVEPEYRKMGFATEALNLLVKYSFNHLKVRRIWCNIMAGNRNSVKLFFKAGFKLNSERPTINDCRDLLFLTLDGEIS